jgi:hypothetical protein
MAAIGLTTVAIVAPGRILESLPPGAEGTLTQQPVQPVIAGGLAAYAGLLVFSRGWFTPVREELTAVDDTESEGGAERTDAEKSDDDARRESADHAGDVSESLSMLGQDVLRFSTPTNTQPTPDPETEASASTGDGEPDTDSIEEMEPPAGSHSVSISPDEFDVLRSAAPERPQEGGESIVGEEFERTVAEARRSYGDRDDLFGVFDVDQDLADESEFLMGSADTVRKRLIATADAINRSRGGPDGPPSEISEWTTDAAVRSFLDPAHPDALSLLDRIRIWVIPEKMFERVVERSTNLLADAEDGGDDR